MEMLEFEMPLPMDQKNKIVLTKVGKTAFVFNLEGYIKLRKDFKILGSIVGTNCVNFRILDGLPCRLTPFETQLLLEEGIAVLVDKSNIIHKTIPKEVLEEDERNLNESLDQQLDLCKEDRIKEQMHYMEKIVEGKRNKLKKMGVPEKEITLTVDDVIEEIKNDSSQFQRNNCLVQATNQPIFDHTCQIVTDLPRSTSFKYKVFKRLWKQGHFVTSGEAFGADYIAYPGDPMCYHASHVVHVLPEGSSSIEALDMIAKCRLSVTVNKILLFAYEDEGKVVFQQVDWINPNPKAQEADQTIE
ncbi:TSEN34 family protein [Megaselia abdita]